MLGPGGGVNLNRKKGQKSAKIAKANIDVRQVLQEAEDTLNEQAVNAGVPQRSRSPPRRGEWSTGRERRIGRVSGRATPDRGATPLSRAGSIRETAS